MKTDFIGRAKRLEDIDLPRIGAKIGVGEDEIHAFMDVEAAGSGFDEHGRPKMRFEYHKFYKQLRGKQLQTAINMKLAYKSWKSGKHPRDMYPILQRAMKINATAALKSASWGLGQIMGYNHAAAGYPTVQAMVKDFMADEDNHLEGMVGFLIANHLDDDLREHRWSGLARGYNGSQYASHGYHTKLKAAFEKWSRIRDTPYPPDAPEQPKPPEPETVEMAPVKREPVKIEHISKKDRKEGLRELREDDSRTISGGDSIDKITGLGAAITMVTGVVDQTTTALGSIPQWVWPVLIIGGLVAVFWYVRKIKRARIEDHLTGRNIGKLLDGEGG